jgi:pimeloyl-ACP methyl ester carboxylesterase
MGHSLGASKVTHYIAKTLDQRVHGLVLASPGDITGLFISRVGDVRFNRFLKVARDLVVANSPDTVMPEDCVIGLLGHRLSAKTFLDHFGDIRPADAFNFFGREATRPFQDIAEIRVPIMVLYAETGEAVGDADPKKAIDLIRSHAQKAPSFDAFVVPGNHWYNGNETEAMRQVLRWVKKVMIDK